ncbi:hypothetical protein [Mitsuokella sp.]|uniref:hypothetical protein n=1 Tax=unclassified Mitsuokella TaxID=2637239 RepID=UPI003D7D3EAA
MLINHWKYLAAAGLMASAFFCGTNAWQPASVEAAPWIDLNYDGAHTYWTVDKGSVYGAGTSASPLCIQAEHEDDRGGGNAIGTRFYSFKQVNGVWKYRYYGYTGKGGKIPYTSWYNVSGDQLANDILYVALN